MHKFVLMNDIICKRFASGRDCRIAGIYIRVLIYADDLLLILSTCSDLRRMLRTVFSKPTVYNTVTFITAVFCWYRYTAHFYLDLDLRTWPRYDHDELPHRIFKSKVFLFKSCCPDTKIHTADWLLHLAPDNACTKRNQWHTEYSISLFHQNKISGSKKRNIINKLINLTMNKARQHIEHHTEHVTVLTMNTIK